MTERGRAVAVPLFCLGALAGSVLVFGPPGASPLTRHTALRGAAAQHRRLTVFGSPEDREREYKKGMEFGAAAPRQVAQPWVPTESSQGGSFFHRPGSGFHHPGTGGYETPGWLKPWLELIGLNNHCTGWLLLAQAIFAGVYYFTVVKHYPYWHSPTPGSSHLQAMFAPMATMHTSLPNCLLSACCFQAREAHTLSRTMTCDYWFSCIAMFICPFCTICYANTCTDVNSKLGGEPVSMIWSAITTLLCPCCVVAQDAESLDAATGAKTGFCSVGPGAGGMHPMPVGGEGPLLGTGPGVVNSGMMGSMGPMGSKTPMMSSGPSGQGMVSSMGGWGSSLTGSGMPTGQPRF